MLEVTACARHAVLICTRLILVVFLRVRAELVASRLPCLTSHMSICPGPTPKYFRGIRINRRPNGPQYHPILCPRLYVLRLAVVAVLMESWAAGIVQGRNDLAIVLANDRVLGSVQCRSQSDGIASVGWPCLFRPMPHVCVFESEEVRGNEHHPQE